MSHEELSELSDQELLDKAKKMKSASITSALLIGFMIGVIIYSVAKNTVGLFTLIPLFFAYKLLSKPDENKALKEVLEKRGLTE